MATPATAVPHGKEARWQRDFLRPRVSHEHIVAPSPFSASEWGKFQEAGFINGAVEIRLSVMGLFPRYL